MKKTLTLTLALTLATPTMAFAGPMPDFGGPRRRAPSGSGKAKKKSKKANKKAFRKLEMALRTKGLHPLAIAPQKFCIAMMAESFPLGSDLAISWSDGNVCAEANDEGQNPRIKVDKHNRTVDQTEAQCLVVAQLTSATKMEVRLTTLQHLKEDCGIEADPILDELKVPKPEQPKVSRHKLLTAGDVVTNGKTLECRHDSVSCFTLPPPKKKPKPDSGSVFGGSDGGGDSEEEPDFFTALGELLRKLLWVTLFGGTTWYHVAKRMLLVHRAHKAGHNMVANHMAGWSKIKLFGGTALGANVFTAWWGLSTVLILGILGLVGLTGARILASKMAEVEEEEA